VSGGPWLANVSTLSNGSTIDVSVGREAVSLVLFSESAHDSNVTISVEVSGGVRFSVDAMTYGSIPLGFLDLNAAGRPGANFTVPLPMAMASTGFHALVYTGAEAYRVTDIFGNLLVYVTPSQNGRFAFSNAADSLTMEGAINLDYAANVNPYVQIAGHHTQTYWWDVTTGSRTPLAQDARAFDMKLPSTFSVAGGAHAKFTIEITNGGASNECYVQYSKFFDFHLWYFSTQCP
jgi:hypothetical protein